ncbi:hypothetical protein L6452_42220 [Arctium lappa]|uniref:Uncharacterized protein n=1 Tax=Arctium lappa TaxID=4217 RepID=A0ACB8XLQ5_ARCLA|nr:hypothetical protein L6452_42220 [Arctium lappa]
MLSFSAVTSASEAMKLLKTIWTNIVERPKAEVDKILKGPGSLINGKLTYSSPILLVATKMGNIEFVVELIREYPGLIWKKNDNNQSIFHIAVTHRQESIYSFYLDMNSQYAFRENKGQLLKKREYGRSLRKTIDRFLEREGAFLFHAFFPAPFSTIKYLHSTYFLLGLLIRLPLLVALIEGSAATCPSNSSLSIDTCSPCGIAGFYAFRENKGQLLKKREYGRSLRKTIDRFLEREGAFLFHAFFPAPFSTIKYLHSTYFLLGLLIRLPLLVALIEGSAATCPSNSSLSVATCSPCGIAGFIWSNVIEKANQGGMDDDIRLDAMILDQIASLSTRGRIHGNNSKLHKSIDIELKGILDMGKSQAAGRGSATPGRGR